MYGKEREKEAVRTLNTVLVSSGRCVKQCGLFVDTDTGYLAASPDGVIDQDTLVEIKCPIKCLGETVF